MNIAFNIDNWDVVAFFAGLVLVMIFNYFWHKHYD